MVSAILLVPCGVFRGCPHIDRSAIQSWPWEGCTFMQTSTGSKQKSRCLSFRVSGLCRTLYLHFLVLSLDGRMKRYGFWACHGSQSAVLFFWGGGRSKAYIRGLGFTAAWLCFIVERVGLETATAMGERAFVFWRFIGVIHYLYFYGERESNWHTFMHTTSRTPMEDVGYHDSNEVQTKTNIKRTTTNRTNISYLDATTTDRTKLATSTHDGRVIALHT